MLFSLEVSLNIVDLSDCLVLGRTSEQDVTQGFIQCIHLFRSAVGHFLEGGSYNIVWRVPDSTCHVTMNTKNDCFRLYKQTVTVVLLWEHPEINNVTKGRDERE